MPSPPKLLDRVREAARTRYYSRRTEEAYVGWIRRYIIFHHKTHPDQMGASEISECLTWLAVARRVSASTQNQALSALLFLYKQVLVIEIGSVPPVVRARTPDRLPVVLSRHEVVAILKQLTGTGRLVVTLLYGAEADVLPASPSASARTSCGIVARLICSRTPPPARNPQNALCVPSRAGA